MKIEVRERGYTPYATEVESLEEIDGFQLGRAVRTDPKAYGLKDTFAGKFCLCLVDEAAEIAVSILED